MEGWLTKEHKLELGKSGTRPGSCSRSGSHGGRYVQGGNGDQEKKRWRRNKGMMEDARQSSSRCSVRLEATVSSRIERQSDSYVDAGWDGWLDGWLLYS